MIVNNHILTEGSDFIDTEASDRLITEQGSETGGTGNVPLIPGRWQYQALAWCPMLISAAPPLDKLQPILDIPIVAWAGKALITAIMAGSSFMPPTVPPPSAPPLDGWIGQKPDTIFRAKEERYIYPSYFGIEKQPLPKFDSWQGQWPDLIFRPKDPRYWYPSTFRPDQRPFDVQSPDKYGPYLEEPIARLADLSYMPDWWFHGPLVPVVAPDKWHPLTEQPARSFKDQSYITDSEFSPDPLPFFFADRWHPLIEVRMWEPKDLSYIVPQEWLWDSSYDADYSGIWQFQDVVPFERPDNRYTAPWEFRTDVVVAAVVTPWDWNIHRPDFVLRRVELRYTYPTGDLVLTTAQRPENITLDKWIGTRPDLLFRFRDPRVLYPHLAWPEMQPVPRADSWYGQKPDLIFRGKDPRVLYPHLAWPEVQPLPRADSWFGQKPDQFLKARDFRFLYPVEGRSFVVSQPEIITLDKWYVEPEIPVRRVDQRNYITIGDLELTPGQRPENITLDKWYNDLRQPVQIFTLRKWQYLYPSLEEFYVGKPIIVASNQRIIIVEGRLAIRVSSKNEYIFL